MPHLSRLLIPFLVVGLSGCASVLPRTSYDEMPERFVYEDFAFDRPPNDRWFAYDFEATPEDCENPSLMRCRVIFRRRLESSTHSFYALVALTALPSHPASHEEFAKLARADRGPGWDPSMNLSYHQEPTTIQNQWCIRIEHLNARERRGRRLHWTVRGFSCLHPSREGVRIEFIYSERGLLEELDPALEEEGEQFLNGVRIAPGGLQASAAPRA